VATGGTSRIGRIRVERSAVLLAALAATGLSSAALAQDWRSRPIEDPWRPSAEQLAQCERVERDYLSLTYCKRRADGQWIILDETLPSLIPGAYITFTDHEGRFCVYAHAPYANDGRSRPAATTVCRTEDGRYVDSDSIP